VRDVFTQKAPKPRLDAKLCHRTKQVKILPRSPLYQHGAGDKPKDRQMNEQQKQWIEALKTLLNLDREDSSAAYEKLVNDVQIHVDAAPEP